MCADVQTKEKVRTISWRRRYRRHGGFSRGQQQPDANGRFHRQRVSPFHFDAFLFHDLIVHSRHRLYGQRTGRTAKAEPVPVHSRPWSSCDLWGRLSRDIPVLPKEEFGVFVERWRQFIHRVPVSTYAGLWCNTAARVKQEDVVVFVAFDFMINADSPENQQSLD